MKKQPSKWLRIAIVRKGIAALSGALFFVTLFLFLYFHVERIHTKDELSISKSYTTFQSEVTQMIERNIYLLQGYLSYIETQDLTEKEMNDYLAHLTMEDMGLIRNVSVLQDTTIIFVYPKEENQTAIGKDLAKVAEQRKGVLEVKNSRRLLLFGPQKLVQGGEGFIVRIPIIRHKEDYWGQLSLVLESAEFKKRIEDAARRNNLRVCITSSETGKIIYDELEGDKEEALSFVMHKDYLDWTVRVIPRYGWSDYKVFLAKMLFLNLMLSLGVAFGVYWNMNQKQRFIQLASRDFLTGLFNRHHLDLVQEQWVGSGKNRVFGIIMVDLNAFKSINDTYGHKIGDYVLRYTAHQIVSIAGAKDLVFRIGGDEFLIIVPDATTSDEMKHYEERIKKAFESPFREGEIVLQVSPALGSALYPLNGHSLDEVMSVADMYMYENKRKR